MADLLRCADYQGREVVLPEEWWHEHIVSARPYLAGHHEYVQLALQNPYRVFRDVERSARECFYRHRTLPGKYHDLYFKIVVEYRRTGPSGLLVGTVVTAYPTKAFKPKEQQLWP